LCDRKTTPVHQLRSVTRPGDAGSPDGGRDLFVRITAVQKAGYTNLVQGVRVSYEMRRDREGNPSAESLQFA